MNIRNAATWLLEKESIPRFMRMNELPHVSASAMKIIQWRSLRFFTEANIATDFANFADGLSQIYMNDQG